MNYFMKSLITLPLTDAKNAKSLNIRSRVHI